MSDLTDEKIEWLRSHVMSTTESQFQSVLIEVQRHRAMVKRLEGFVSELERTGRPIQAEALRLRMKGTDNV